MCVHERLNALCVHTHVYERRCEFASISCVFARVYCLCAFICVTALKRVNKLRAPVRQKYAQDRQQLSVLTHMVFSGSSADVPLHKFISACGADHNHNADTVSAGKSNNCLSAENRTLLTVGGWECPLCVHLCFRGHFFRLHTPPSGLRLTLPLEMIALILTL